MKKYETDITPEMLTQKARKQIVTVIAVGVILIFIDLISGVSAGNIDLVYSGNKMFMIRPSAGQKPGHLYLKAEIETSEGIFEKKVTVKLDPYEKAENKGKGVNDDSGMSREDLLDYKIRSITDNFNKNRSKTQIILPDRLESGEKISWEKDPQNNTVAILMSMLLLITLIYITRFDSLKKTQKNKEASVMKHLPEFINRLVLLLNAGMVLNSAFEKSVEESMKFESPNDYFTCRMKEIYMSVKNTNGVMHQELKNFARESGIKELMRISNIISDNINKGVELTQKLQNENQILWIARKKSCEERGRLAETKLTLPLLIFLIVLIVIVVSPALLEL